LVNAPLVGFGRVRIEVCLLFVKDFLERIQSEPPSGAVGL
jgi:hypothetical protein